MTGMDSDEAAQREAEHKAAALYNLGTFAGTGAAVWARTVQDELARHESARERWGTGVVPKTWEQLHGSALVIVVAIHQILGFERRVRRLTGDAELAQARARFDAMVPDAKALRDLVAHLDSYAVGEGRRRRGQATPPIKEQYLAPFIYWTEAEMVFRLGNEQVSLRAAAEAATELAEVVERVRAEHQERAGQEANALRRKMMRRRFGLTPEGDDPTELPGPDG
jgi:hypothetical protein